jgi:hypothetical protein
MKIKILKESKKKTEVSASGQERVSKKIAYLIDKEGMDQKQAAAVAYSMEERGELAEDQLEEISAMGGGAVGGAMGGGFVPEDEKKKIEELFSTSTSSGIGINSPFPGKKVHDGNVEKHQYRNVRNVMEDDDDTLPPQGDTDEETSGIKWKLSDFADSPRNASRVFDVLNDIEENIGLERLRNAILADSSSSSRVDVMSKKFGYRPELLDNIEANDEDAIRKYYQFLINEFLFWIAYNPMSSAQQYASRRSMLSKPTRDLAYGLISQYVSDPSKNNPKAKGQRMAAQAEDYKLDKDLDPALYELPEE